MAHIDIGTGKVGRGRIVMFFDGKLGIEEVAKQNSMEFKGKKKGKVIVTPVDDDLKPTGERKRVCWPDDLEPVGFVD